MTRGSKKNSYMSNCPMISDPIAPPEPFHLKMGKRGTQLEAEWLGCGSGKRWCRGFDM